MKVPPPIRRHEFRYAKYARLTFMDGCNPPAGRMEVYCKNRLYLAVNTFLSTDIWGKPICQRANYSRVPIFILTGKIPSSIWLFHMLFLQ
ncbi:MAG: hypothetical protein HFG65_02225 [Hungatella sp.]|nr:hypothetical protein [Hungatella sp.]